ncbi:MAG: hypothetical protein QUV05_06160 [Phycisphaerae bacterium]|nr:hypothetical protein [Phycisphaerae bacterium]
MRLRWYSLELAAAVIVAGWLSPTVAWACGPNFPNRLLTDGDNAVLKPPTADFTVEVDQIQLPGKADMIALLPEDGNKSRQTTDTDLTELREALQKSGLTATERDALFSRYQDIREQIWDFLADQDEHQLRRSYGLTGQPESQPAEPTLEDFEIPKGLPAEFADYLQGAVAYHRKEHERARQSWTRLLDRPADDRRNRSVWAAYMLGRSWVEEDPNKAVLWFEKTRALAREGFRDSTGLAAASLGWQARAELQQKRYAEALTLYLRQSRTGDDGAHVSLRMTVERLLKENQAILAGIAADPLAQQVVTAYIVARGGPRWIPWGAPDQKLVMVWLRAVEKADARDVPGAGRLAWLAYQYDDMPSARRWLALTPQDLPIARWLRAKLLLYDGKIEPAAAILADLVKLFPQDETGPDSSSVFAAHAVEWEDAPAHLMLWGEIGVLHMARHQYVEAMDALLRGGYWMDAAYVAERVLTISELKRYVDARYPRQPNTAPSSRPEKKQEDEQDELEQEYRFGTPGPLGLASAMRHLLARRLAREKRWDEARAYYPDKWREVFDNYMTALRAGHDTGKSKEHRAESLMEAAAIARWDGMDLLGTELEPDWSSLQGSFEMEAASEVRAEAGGAKVVPSSTDERRRLRQHVEPRKRWHYRYIAADLAWQAAELMPNESEETARLLCEAGSWIKARDPKAADRFYKALVRRCGKTELGKKADKLRWFPPLKADEWTETQPDEHEP